ncbi:hypothetical protein [Aestuariivirga sp.]|jgi:hypothetical protein|uniref:hypothetical protein n=1 Tax=Aestuariivirga sp. TaxID=2650926 RepID=UPI0037842FEE
MSLRTEFHDRGLLRFAADKSMLAWAEHARTHAATAARDINQAHWLRCGGTWFVGVDALPNDAEGRLAGGPPLAGAAADAVRSELGLSLPLHRGQVSICYPGYPRPSDEESAAAFSFRLKRDAAHVDGLLAEGPERRRFLREPHAYVLGVTLTEQSAGASPLVVWEGSHHIMYSMFRTVLGRHPPGDWQTIDLTEAYQSARRQAFETCRRVALPTGPGDAVLLHRHLLHGVAPWAEGATAPSEGRIIAYFRPEFPDLRDWLDHP